LLLYCPPLLDILPMYVIFLALTPVILSAAVRWGWKRVMGVSVALWILAQFGLRDAVHNMVVRITHLPIPLQETGAFNLFAWQLVWIAGLWLGAKSAEGDMPLKRVPGRVIALSAAVCLFFVGVRHNWLGLHLTQQTLGMLLDKWSIGPLRVLNLITFTIVLYWLRKYVLKLVAVEPFATPRLRCPLPSHLHLFRTDPCGYSRSPPPRWKRPRPCQRRARLPQAGSTIASQFAE
jgi:hypothetical protein